MSSTIPTLITDANSLYTGLTEGVDVDLSLPVITLPTDFVIPTDPVPVEVNPLTIDDLTTKVVGGTGVFDALMTAVSAHLAEQHSKNRITGGDYAKTYLGALQGVMQFGVQFLLGKDRVVLENLQLKEAIKLTQAQVVRAQADVQIARGEIQRLAFEVATAKLKALTARNEYALSKMELVNGYNNVLGREAQITLTLEQVDSERARTKDTITGGLPVAGILGKEKDLMDAKALTAREELDSARAQTKDTLLDGSPISGIVAIEKAYKEAQQVHMENQGELIQEQVEATRAQTRDTLTTGQPIAGILAVEKQIKLAQKDLTKEQADAARASTWETHVDGSPIAGIAKFEKDLKQAQAKLVQEQYETQRGHTRGTLSTGEVVGGMLGAQTALYNQQVVSYKRDAEVKAIKSVLDTWVTRKTIDDGVAVPSIIDTASINTMLTTHLGQLQLT